jgi:serine/threonine protein kinase
MADVYRAYDPLLDRDVALKVLRSRREGDDPQRARRIIREARAAAALTHPNTVTIYEVGEADGEVFIAMELLAGESLRAKLGRGGITLEQKLEWLLQAARALDAAHDRGLVHRDVKPDNMFVCNDGTLKLLDFGIAKRDVEDIEDTESDITGPSSIRTSAGRRVGTPRYMAPEQHASQPTDPRTDEYAWGLVAFELVTGQHPGGAVATVTAGEQAEGPSTLSVARLATLRSKVPELDENVSSAIARALEPTKARRFPSMKPLIEALEQRRSLPRPAPAPQAPRRTSAWRIALVAVGLAGGGAIAVRGLGTRPPPQPLPPRFVCKVDSVRSFPLADADRMAVAPDGQIIVARDALKVFRPMRETPEGSKPLVANPTITTMLSALASNRRNVTLYGTLHDGLPGIAAELEQGEDRGTLVVGASESGVSMQRIQPFVTGVAVAHFEKQRLVIGATTLGGERKQGLSPGAEVYFVEGTKGGPRVAVETGAANSPAMATSTNRIAFAYRFDGATKNELHLSLLDERGRRIGDAHVVPALSRTAPPAVAFAGTSPMVLWVDDAGAKTRLMWSMLGSELGEMSTPAVASDEPIESRRPLTAQLPSGESVVLWETLGPARALRLSPIGKDGKLTAATDVTRQPGFEDVAITSGERGVFVSWLGGAADGGKTASVAEVSCALAPSVR